MVMKSVAGLSSEILLLVECEPSRPITTAGDRDTVNVASTGLKQPARIVLFSGI